MNRTPYLESKTPLLEPAFRWHENAAFQRAASAIRHPRTVMERVCFGTDAYRG